MITKWGKIVAQTAFLLCGDRRDGDLIKDATGTDYYYFARANSNSWPNGNPFASFRVANPASSTSNYGIFVGSGATAPTENDYTLESPITSGISGSTSFANTDGHDEQGNPYNKTVLTIRNTSNSDITISEIGFFIHGQCYTQNKNSNGSNRLIMIDHTLLNTPVTIPAGESAAITYTIKVVLPSS